MMMKINIKVLMVLGYSAIWRKSLKGKWLLKLEVAFYKPKFFKLIDLSKKYLFKNFK